MTKKKEIIYMATVIALVLLLILAAAMPAILSLIKTGSVEKAKVYRQDR